MTKIEDTGKEGFLNESSKILGIIVMIFYVLVILYPYLYRLYIRDCTLLKDPTLSTGFAKCSKPVEVTLIFNFVFFMMWLFAYRGTYFNLDHRLAFPIMMWIFGTASMIMLWVTPNYESHKIVAGCVIFSAQIFALVVWGIYKELYKEDIRYKHLEGFAWSSFAVAICIMGFVIFTKEFRAIGILEIIHTVLIGGALYSYTSLPPLPSINVIQFPFSNKEVKEEIRDQNRLMKN